MLGKVFRYELKASSRFLLPVSGACALAILALLAGRGIASFLMTLPESSSWYGLGEIADILFTLFGSLLFCGILFLFMGAMAVRFYQSFCGNEAYTTFTLPVSISTQILGRLLACGVYSLVAGLLTLCSGYFLFPMVFWSDASFNVLLSPFVGFSPFSAALVLLGILLFLSIGLLMGYLQLCASIAIGGQFRSARIPISIAAYFVLNTVESIITMLITLIPAAIYISGRVGLTAMVDGLNAMNEVDAIWLSLQWIFGYACITLVISLVFCVVHFFLCRWLYTKRLNLP